MASHKYFLVYPVITEDMIGDKQFQTVGEYPTSDAAIQDFWFKLHKEDILSDATVYPLQFTVREDATHNYYTQLKDKYVEPRIIPRPEYCYNGRGCRCMARRHLEPPNILARCNVL